MQDKIYMVKKDIVIKEGTVLRRVDGTGVLYRRVWHGPHYSHLMDYGRDRTAEFVIDMETVDAFPDLFSKLEGMVDEAPGG